MQAVNKTAKSIIEVLPTLPPEQINYIETEQDSKNADRIIAIGDTSIYKMYRMRININNIKPSLKKEYQLNIWISAQQKNYKIKKEGMSNIIIYNTWNEFINDPKYKKYFINKK